MVVNFQKSKIDRSCCEDYVDRSFWLLLEISQAVQLKMQVLQTVSVRAVEVTSDDYPIVGQLSFCCKQVVEQMFISILMD